VTFLRQHLCKYGTFLPSKAITLLVESHTYESKPVAKQSRKHIPATSLHISGFNIKDLFIWLILAGNT